MGCGGEIAVFRKHQTIKGKYVLPRVHLPLRYIPHGTTWLVNCKVLSSSRWGSPPIQTATYSTAFLLCVSIRVASAVLMTWLTEGLWGTGWTQTEVCTGTTETHSDDVPSLSSWNMYVQWEGYLPPVLLCQFSGWSSRVQLSSLD